MSHNLRISTFSRPTHKPHVAPLPPHSSSPPSQSARYCPPGRCVPLSDGDARITLPSSLPHCISCTPLHCTLSTHEYLPYMRTILIHTCTQVINNIFQNTIPLSLYFHSTVQLLISFKHQFTGTSCICTLFGKRQRLLR